MTDKSKTLRTLLADPRLQALGERYEPDASNCPGLAARLQAYGHQLGADRFVLPIAGIQGSGKSTLLNAIAFDEPVLPIDADETTCVPVEIHWAASPTPQATVHYTDGRTSTLPCTEEALRSVVHNANNPANEKEVARVVLESNREMFRKGLVLVDLPGVGSITAANAATTRRYLEEAVGVIFMLRTVPPLTRSEATFVGLHWAALRTAIFVQNRWDDETDEEALAGCDYNAQKLQEVAKQARIELKGPPKIRAVNGYKALRAALTRDDVLAASSGLSALRIDLENLGGDWSSRVKEDVRIAVEAELDRLTELIGRRLKAAQLDQGELADRIREEAARFDEQLLDLDTRMARMRKEANAFRQSVRNRLRAWSNDKGAELRNRMRSKMRAGIVDGPRLARALADEQAITTDDIFIEVQQDALALQDSLRIELENLNEWRTDAPDLRFTVDTEERTKWENLAKPAGSAGGAAGGAWAGLEAGAWIGGGLAGPPGAAIGGALGAIVGGLLGGLAGNWLGSKSKENVNEQRMRAVEGEVNKAIDDYVRETAKALTTLADTFCQRLDELLEHWRTSKTGEFEVEQAKCAVMMNSSEEEKVRIVDELTTDLAALTSVRTQLNAVAA